MFKSKSYQKRAVSAGSSSQKKHRIISAKSNSKKHGRIHTESFEATHETVKPIRSRLYTSGMDHTSKFTEQSSKGPQQLFEQNFHLKVELKDLNNKLNLTRSKIESQKKKHLTYSRKLNRQFEKQLYWPCEKSGSDYLITGIKHQYQKLKQTLQQKCTQIEMLRQTISYSNIEELNAYCESLEVQNKILIQNITYLKKQKKKQNKFQHNSSFSHFSNPDLDYLINEERKKDQTNKKRIKALEQEAIKIANQEKQHLKKIDFLEKLIIQKQNETYHMTKKMKTIEREKSKILNELKGFEAKLLERQRQNEQKFNEYKQKADRQAKVEKAMFQKLIKQKTTMVQKLQKQIAYLSTLLSYWKPLDQLGFDRDVNSSSQKGTISVNMNQSISLHGNSNREIVRSKTPLNLMLYEENTNNDEKFMIRTSQREEILLGKNSSNNTIQREDSDKFSKGDSNPNREPRRSTKKWSQDAKKNRRVEFTEIQHLGELIRFKMIAGQKTLKEVRELFACKIPKPSCSKLQQELIKMKEVRQILEKTPFKLCEQQAQLLSRYIVEDQGVEYVYTHEGNEIQRSIVKSIIKTIIGEYELPDSMKAQEKWKQIKKNYSHNMQLALKSICPKGTVSKNKFQELMNSLGIQSDDETKNYLIGKMVENQASLKALKYDLLFEPHQRIQ